MTDRTNGRAVVCQIGTRRFALPVSAVREVCTGIAVVRVPGVAPSVEGVANVRGTLVTVIRGEVMLGTLPASPGVPSPWLVVLSMRGGRVGLGVDDVLPNDADVTDLIPVDLDGALAAVLSEPTA